MINHNILFIYIIIYFHSFFIELVYLNYFNISISLSKYIYINRQNKNSIKDKISKRALKLLIIY